MNEVEKKNLFLEIADESLFFLAGEINEDYNFEILEKLAVKSTGIYKGKIIDIEKVSEILKNSLEKIENKIDHTFKSINIISNQKKIDCVNVTGFKKLNGEQILNEDISHIINYLKKNVIENEVQKKIIHLFNSKYLLDNQDIKNLPIGLHGEFYSHQLTFFLINKNDFKNIQMLLKKSNLALNRIIFKNYVDGINVIKENKMRTSFVNINIEKDNIQISVFDDSSFVYYENFEFGLEIILKDIVKVCSLHYENVKNILSEIKIEEINFKDKKIYIDEKFFKNENFRKISIEHLKNIIEARIVEILDIIYNKNINLINIKNNKPILIKIVQDETFKNLITIIKKNINNNQDVKISSLSQNDEFNSCIISADLVNNGWIKEAIPFTKNKKSLISRIFTKLFE